MAKRKKRERYTGALGIGDRVAFIMPGERYVTAGEILDMSGDTLTMGNLSGVSSRPSSLATVGGRPMEGPGTTLTIQRGLVVENKSQARRDEIKARRNRKGGRRGKRGSDRTGSAGGGSGHRTTTPRPGDAATQAGGDA